MTTRKRKPADLTGIRRRGARFQVRIFGGIDQATGKQLILTGSAATEAVAVAISTASRVSGIAGTTSPCSACAQSGPPRKPAAM
jgi:hypothetical protein